MPSQTTDAGISNTGASFVTSPDHSSQESLHSSVELITPGINTSSNWTPSETRTPVMNRTAPESTHLRIVYGSGGPVKNAGFPNNRQVNSKYTFLNFLPKNLGEQFSLHMNRYFLLIACLQLVSVITPVSPVSTWAPLIVIFGITAVKEAIDDKHRADADKVANERLYDVILPPNDQRGSAETHTLVRIQAQSILVGDIVRLRDGEEVPCDLCVLWTSQSGGECLVQTMNLDGETNLKVRKAVDETSKLTEHQVEQFRGVLECGAPDANVYSFDARLWVKEDDHASGKIACSVSSEQLLQQTITLKNTEYIFGMAVYTGPHTKFAQNKDVVRIKRTQTDEMINRISIYLFCFQLFLVLVLGVIGNLNIDPNGMRDWYLDFNGIEFYEWLIIPARFLLLISTIIPISLKVTLDVCKLYYAKFIGWDLRLFDARTKPAVANNTSIGEDLGQVAYVLSDKTGTLTSNEMVFRMCTIGGRNFDSNQCSPTGALSEAVQNKNDEVLEFFRNIALNNEVIPVRGDDGKVHYKGPSPDEEALVLAALAYGIELVSRKNRKVEILVNGQIEKYDTLKKLDFTSDRRRMSVVMRNLETGKLRLYCKGADDVVFQRLRSAASATLTQSHVDAYAEAGLRTLAFGHTDLDEGTFSQWANKFAEASTAVSGREEAVSAVCELLEKDLELAGASAIEDRLQDDVGSTIKLLREAGVRFWMLTGDKFSTAVQIAHSCHLTPTHGKMLEITAVGVSDAQDQLSKHTNDIVLQSIHSYTVILRGSSLAACLDPSTRDSFLRICLDSSAVICCRFSPRQKAQVVKLVKEAGNVTLAIGDGGNDVSMIQEAHVGVGIRGKEGLQAARAADFQINYFRALKPLLLLHGRQSYLRTALMTQYSYYKSFMFCTMQLAYAFVSTFSGVTLFNTLCVTAYNALFFVPVLTYIFDQDLPGESIYQLPKVYKLCQRSVHFNFLTYLLWMLRALYQAIVVFAIVMGCYGATYHHAGTGSPIDYEALGNAAFAPFLWVQTLTLLFEMQYITMINQVVIWGFHAFAFLIMIMANSAIALDNFFGYYSFFFVLGDPIFWLSSLLATVAAMAPIVALRYIQSNYFPTMIDVARLHLSNNPDRSQPTRTANARTHCVDMQ